MKNLKKFQDRTLLEQKELRELLEQEFEDVKRNIFKKTGYYLQSSYSILVDDVAKSVDVDIDIALLKRPHNFDEDKVKHYLKVNPHNCLNESILVFKYDNWYEIYNGVHRTEANKRLGKKKIKATIIVPDNDTQKEKGKQ